MTTGPKEVLREYISDSDFCERIEQAYDALDNAKHLPCKEVHGVGLVLKLSDDNPHLDRYTRGKPAYNGRPHSIHDSDISDVIAANRHKDGAVEIDSQGNFMRKHVILPMDPVVYQEHWGIGVDYPEFLGYAPDEEPPGTRATSALYATMVIPDIVIITLGEDNALNIYMNGDRIYNSDGKKVRWDLAKNKPGHIRLEPSDFGEIVPTGPKKALDTGRYLVTEGRRTAVGE